MADPASIALGGATLAHAMVARPTEGFVKDYLNNRSISKSSEMGIFVPKARTIRYYHHDDELEQVCKNFFKQYEWMRHDFKTPELQLKSAIAPNLNATDLMDRDIKESECDDKIRLIGHHQTPETRLLGVILGVHGGLIPSECKSDLKRMMLEDDWRWHWFWKTLTKCKESKVATKVLNMWCQADYPFALCLSLEDLLGNKYPFHRHIAFSRQWKVSRQFMNADKDLERPKASGRRWNHILITRKLPNISRIIRPRKWGPFCDVDVWTLTPNTFRTLVQSCQPLEWVLANTTSDDLRVEAYQQSGFLPLDAACLGPLKYPTSLSACFDLTSQSLREVIGWKAMIGPSKGSVSDRGSIYFHDAKCVFDFVCCKFIDGAFHLDLPVLTIHIASLFCHIDVPERGNL